MPGFQTSQNTLVGGFQYLDNIEFQSNESGAEALVTYVGPFENRFIFLNWMFGTWTSPSASCTSTLLGRPVPLPHFFQPSAGGVSINSDELTLYPDTYRVRISGDPTPLGPTLIDNGDGPHAINNTFTTGNIYNTFQGCEAEITISYRHKLLEAWPYPYTQGIDGTARCICNAADFLDEEGEVIDLDTFRNIVPTIRAGTFIEILESSSRIEFQSVPSRSLKFTPDTTIESPYSVDFDDCKRQDTSDAEEPIERPRLPEDVNAAVQTETTLLTIRWMNLPLVPNMRRFIGKTNQTQFLDFPPHAVYCSGITPYYKGTGGGAVPLIDIDIHFIVKEAQVDLPSGAPNPTRVAKAHFGIVCKRIGLWGKAWSDCPVGLSLSNPFDKDDVVFWTNWVDISSERGKVFESISFSDMFSF